VTVVARGLIAVSPDRSGRFTEHNANGFVVPRAIENQFLLARTWTPWKRVGSLVGAFKPDFSDAFAIGTEGTFFAPVGASTLFLAVNDVAGGYNDNSGQGFVANVVATDPVVFPTRLSLPANPTSGRPGLPEAAANLPRLNLELFRVDQARKIVEPVGYVAYAVYGTHGRNGGDR